MFDTLKTVEKNEPENVLVEHLLDILFGDPKMDDLATMFESLNIHDRMDTDGTDQN
jgi:hypothetical protein